MWFIFLRFVFLSASAVHITIDVSHDLYLSCFKKTLTRNKSEMAHSCNKHSCRRKAIAGLAVFSVRNEKALWSTLLLFSADHINVVVCSGAVEGLNIFQHDTWATATGSLCAAVCKNSYHDQFHLLGPGGSHFSQQVMAKDHGSLSTSLFFLKMFFFLSLFVF